MGFYLCKIDLVYDGADSITLNWLNEVFYIWLHECGILVSGIQIFTVERGSEIWASLKFEWSKRGWVANGPDFEWDLEAIWKPKRLKYRQMAAILLKKRMKSRQKYLDVEWFGI